MGQKKKITEKLNSFYRGPVTGPSKVADENETQTVVLALDECIPKRDYAFEVQFYGARQLFKIVMGLSACMRFIKRKRTAAILYDETLGPHVVKYLNEFARNLDIHSIQVPGLTKNAPKYDFNSLLAVSIVTLPTGLEEQAMKEDGPKPKALKGIIKSEAFDSLCRFLGLADLPKPKETIEFKPPLVDKISSSGKKKRKKKAKGGPVEKKVVMDLEIANTETPS